MTVETMTTAPSAKTASNMEIIKNVGNRQQAQTVIELCAGQSPGFWHALLDLVRKQCGETEAQPAPCYPITESKMSDEEAHIFERTANFPRLIIYGDNSYLSAGIRVIDLPTEIIAQLGDTSFFRELKAYLKSDRFKVRHKQGL